MDVNIQLQGTVEDKELFVPDPNEGRLDEIGS